MTIKDMEKLSGIAKANIRYYEQEGLISPERLPNGYRDYGEKELAVLEKIKLLRELGVTIEDIHAMQQGEEELSAVMSRRLYELEKERKTVEHAKDVCRSMREAGERYDTLDVAKYRRALPPEQPPVRVVAEARQPDEKPHPWRRLFARSIDLILYNEVLNILLILALGYNAGMSGGARIIIFFVSPLVMLLTEPIMLSLFGATVGKLIFGLRVLDSNGCKLSYGQGYRRTRDIVVHGLGFRLPVYELILLVKNWVICRRGDLLPWEEESDVVGFRLRWRHGLFFLGFAAAEVVIFAVMFLLLWLPPNLGELTVAEFAENYNHYAEFLEEHNIAYLGRIDSDGQYIHANNAYGYEVEQEVEFEYTLENGLIRAISCNCESEGAQMISGNAEKQNWTVYAFAGAGGKLGVFNGIFNDERKLMDQAIQSTAVSDLSFKIGNVIIERDVEHSGFDERALASGAGSTVLVKQEDAETRYRESFRISIE